MGYLIGVTYCLLWYSSILAGYVVLFCPLLPLLFISNKKYRKTTDIVFAIWQTYPTALLELLCGCDVQVTGDRVDPSETCLLVVNHRTRTDWNFLWPALQRAVAGDGGPANPSYPTKFVLKDALRHVPGPGWAMQLACFVYVKRSWPEDRARIGRALDYFADLRYRYSVALFPEGTDLTERTRAASDRYAESNGLQKYKHVLHPRTTGFAYLASKMLDLDSPAAVYDVTLVYCDAVPQTELDLLRGNFPKTVKVHLTRFPARVLPKSADALRAFLRERWAAKERVLREFFASGKFLHGAVLRGPHGAWVKYASVAFWGLMPAFAVYLLASSSFYRQVFVVHTAFLILVNVFGEGFQNFEINVHKIKRKLFSIKGSVY